MIYNRLHFKSVLNIASRESRKKNRYFERIFNNYFKIITKSVGIDQLYTFKVY